MGIEPEHVLKEHRIAAIRWIKDANMEGALQRHQNDGDGYDRRAQHLNEAGGVGCPYKQWQAEPSQTGRPHAMDSHDEVQTRQNGREACNKNSQAISDYV